MDIKKSAYIIPLFLLGIYFRFTFHYIPTMLTLGLILFWHFRFKKKYLFTNILITFIVLVFAFLLTIEDFSITTPEPLNETTVEKIYLYENKTFSLTNSFMDYDLDWIKEIDSDYSRVRVNDSNSLNSFIFTYNQKAKFEIPLKDGCYNIITYHGDSEFPQGPHYLEIENNIFNHSYENSTNERRKSEADKLILPFSKFKVRPFKWYIFTLEVEGVSRLFILSL